MKGTGRALRVWLGSAPPRQAPSRVGMGGGGDAQGMSVRVRRGPYRAWTVPPPVPRLPTPPREGVRAPSRTLAPRRGEGPPVGEWGDGRGRGVARGGEDSEARARGPVGPRRRGVGALTTAAALARRPRGHATYSPVGGLGLGCAAGGGGCPPVDMGLRRRGGLRGRDMLATGRPSGGLTPRGARPEGSSGQGRRTTIVGNIYHIYVLPTSKVHQRNIQVRVGGPTRRDSPVEGRDSPVGGAGSPVGGKDSPVGGPERRVNQFSKATSAIARICA